MRKALKAVIIISIVLIAIFIITPIAISYYLLHTMEDIFRTKQHQALIEYDKKHNTNYAETGFN